MDKTLFEPTVLFLGNGPAVSYFRDKGIHTIVREGIPIYPHADGARLSFISKKPWRPLTLMLEVKKAAYNLEDWFKKERFDIVHLNTSLMLPLGKAAANADSKVVWHVREATYKGFLGFRRNFVRNWITRYADHVFAISSVEADRLQCPAKVSIVYNYVDFKKFDWIVQGSSIRKEFGLRPNEFILLNLGGLIHSKGADVFVEAARILCAKYKDLKFLIAGDKYTLRKLTTIDRIKITLRQLLGLKVGKGYSVLKKIRKYGLEEKIIFTGMRTDIPQLLAASDLLCWTATVPHFSRPIIEAAAMKKPAVATDFPNTLEALVPEKTGLLFKNKNARDLAEKIEKLYLDRELLRSMGENAYAYAKKKFNAEYNFCLIEAKYFELMGLKSQNEKDSLPSPKITH